MYASVARRAYGLQYHPQASTLGAREVTVVRGGLSDAVGCEKVNFFSTRKFGFGLLVVGLVAYAICAFLFWDWLRQTMGTQESNIATIRNLTAGAGAIVGVYLGAWRISLAVSQTDATQRQVNTAQRQADTAEQGLLNDRYDRGAGLLRSDVLPERLDGIYTLEGLARESAEQYYIRVMNLLCAFVRNPDE